MPKSVAVDALVVGGGFAGLSAAASLKESGASVALLEARERVGGRVESVQLGPQAAVELGAAWVTGEQTVLATFASRLGLQLEAMHAEGATVLLRGKDRLLVEDAEAADPGIEAAIAALDRLAEGVDPRAPGLANDAVLHDRMTLGSWLFAEVDEDETREALRLGAEGYFATAAENVPLLHALFYAKANGGFSHLLGEEGDPISQQRVRGGAQQIALGLARELGSVVRLGEPVWALQHSEAEVTAVTPSLRVSARRAIVALPPTLAQRLRYEPALSWDRDLLTQRWSMGSGWKYHALYERAFWREDGLNGRVIDLGEGTTVFDTSPLEGEPGIATLFLPVDSAAELDRAGEAGRWRDVEAVLVRAFGSRARVASGCHERMWWKEPYSRGDVGVPSLGTWTTVGHTLREPIGPIHWAGSETSTEFPGQMEGALRSGIRAAREVQSAL